MDLTAMFAPTGLGSTATPEEFVTDLLHDVIDRSWASTSSTWVCCAG
jgi:hypothetical protein